MSKILSQILAGALGGATVALVLFNSPGAADLLRMSPEGGSKIPPEAVKEQGTEFAGLVDYEAAVIRTVETANPAVVSIVVTQDVPIIEQYYDEAPGVQSPFGDFFGDGFFSPFQYRVPQYRQRGTEQREVGGGSGFLVSADGFIITNRHVVAEDEASYTVFRNDGTKYGASVIARDPVNDLAVLKIEGDNLSFLQFAPSDDLQVGQTVVAIGNALAEFRNTVSVGVVSGLARSIVAGTETGQTEQLEEVIQTDAAINPGNSGGPLLNIKGEVIGVNVAVALGSENIGFALPAKLVRGVMDSVMKTGQIVRPYIGVRYMEVTAAIQEANNLPVDYGALVARGRSVEELAVIPGSPADKAGLREGDIILEADGVKLDEQRSLASVIRSKSVGDQLALKVLSQGSEKEVRVTLEAMGNGN